MRKTPLLAGLVLAASLVASPVAAETPESEEKCRSLLAEVQAESEKKNLSADVRASVGKMLGELSKQCTEGQYPDAASTAKAIRDLLAKS